MDVRAPVDVGAPADVVNLTAVVEYPLSNCLRVLLLLLMYLNVDVLAFSRRLILMVLALSLMCRLTCLLVAVKGPVAVLYQNLVDVWAPVGVLVYPLVNAWALARVVFLYQAADVMAPVRVWGCL